MSKTIKCPLCNYTLGEEDQYTGYCSICGEELKQLDEVDQMDKRKKEVKNKSI
ncbi:hypothetical protein J4209_04150 [Candidatus Woesearchaeota archaeon]|nr:hypothetical protein [Candidatus Woesearchaeota archaeon]